MAATFKQIVGTPASLSYSGLSTLASGTYVKNTTPYDCTTNDPVDVVVEGTFATTNTPASNKQVLLFVQESIDGTNFRTGPESGTTTTREPNLRLLGVIPLTTASTTERGSFSIVQALGFVPAKFNIIVKNELGVALTSGTIQTAEISMQSV